MTEWDETNIVFLVFSIIGLIELLVIFFIFRYRKKIIAKGYDARARVINVVEARGSKGGRVYKPVISYRTFMGDQIEVQSSIGSNPNYYPVGTELDIYYDPDKPKKFIIKGDKRFRLIFIILGVIASIFFLIGAIGILVAYSGR